MKIQCSCGTKYSFDVTPEMARTPIRLVCQNCGTDISAMVNQIIQSQFAAPAGIGTVPVAAPPPTTDAVVARVHSSQGGIATPSSTTPPVAKLLRVGLENPAASQAQAAPAVEAPQVCLKHHGELTTHKCLICQKPICPKCMELFGFVCSPLCRGKAEAQGLSLPAFHGGKAAAQAKEFSKFSKIAGSVAGVIVVLLGIWFWYAWFGSVPKASYSVRFEQAGYSGQCRLLPNNQVVYLHAGTLARHDSKTKKEIWSQVLIDKKKIGEEAAAAFEQLKAAYEKARASGMEMGTWLLPSLDEVTRDMERSAASALELHTYNEGIWVSYPDKLVRYDWSTGRPGQEIALGGAFHRLLQNGSELLLISRKAAAEVVTHLNLASGESRNEELALLVSSLPNIAGEKKPGAKSAKPVPPGRAPTNLLAQSSSPPGFRQGASQSAGTASARKDQAAFLAGGRTPMPGKQLLDPAAVANKVQGMSRPAKLALPAVLAANANQERALAAMREDEDANLPASVFEVGADGNSLLPDGDRLLQFSTKLVEYKTRQREAMKAPPKKSALDGDVNAASTADVANEIFNEMQRDRGGDVVEEDVSRYQVMLRRPGQNDIKDFETEVTGRPELFPCRSVDVLAAGKWIAVISKTNKKLWESKLNYPVSSRGDASLMEETPLFGEGPAVERGDTLYLFDQGVLTAFDLASGNARWRLPSVGISGLHFDNKGMIYVNASSASPDILRYPNQIDISEKASQLILKVNPATGAIIWQAQQEGLVSYVSGKFLYTTVIYHAEEEETGGPFGVRTGLEMPSHVRIKRLDPGNARVLWEHYQARAPLDIHFERNTIQLLFRKEFQLLKFFSF